MWPLVTYSNYFKIVSSVTFQTRELGLFNNVILYHYTIKLINNDYARFNICSAWFLDIAISTDLFIAEIMNVLPQICCCDRDAKCINIIIVIVFVRYITACT